MNTYLAYVYKDPDSSFGVSFPDLPGCYGAGESYDEAIENAKVALRDYAEAMDDDGHDMPEPRSHGDLMADATEEIEMLDVAFIIEVPLIMIGKTRRVNISIDDEVLAAVDKCAKLAGVSRSAFFAKVAMERIQSSLDVVRARTKKKRRSGKNSHAIA